MAFKAPWRKVGDPGCQQNWEALESTDVTTQAAQAATAASLAGTQSTVAAHAARLALLGTVQQASSTAAQGPGAVSADLVYTPISVSLVAGTWLVYAQATVAASVADGKQIALWDGTAEIANTVGAVEGAGAAGAAALLTTTGVVTLASTTTVSILAKRNGASALTIGFAGVVLVGEQRITAVRLI